MSAQLTSFSQGWLLISSNPP